MSDEDEQTWEQMYAFQSMCVRASQRCKEVAASEAVMGYEESRLTYLVIAAEALDARDWITEMLGRKVTY
jgi:hypothetical protein